jgi:hypothetical protein
MFPRQHLQIGSVTIDAMSHVTLCHVFPHCTYVYARAHEHGKAKTRHNPTCDMLSVWFLPPAFVEGEKFISAGAARTPLTGDRGLPRAVQFQGRFLPPTAATIATSSDK